MHCKNTMHLEESKQSYGLEMEFNVRCDIRVSCIFGYFVFVVLLVCTGLWYFVCVCRSLYTDIFYHFL